MKKSTIIEIIIFIVFIAFSLIGLKILLSMSFTLIRIIAFLIVLGVIIYFIRFMSKE